MLWLFSTVPGCFGSGPGFESEISHKDMWALQSLVCVLCNTVEAQAKKERPSSKQKHYVFSFCGGKNVQSASV